MANLSVREMVLYKHGVGFFVRQGDVSGEQVQLAFRSDEINDILKSLAVFDQAGGQVLGIHYQTPMNREARLASSSVRLSQKSSLRDLIRDLRGRDCLLVFEVSAGSEETIEGRVIGLDEVITQEEVRANVSILTGQGVRVLPYETLRSISIKDEQSAHDLTYFLDTSMAEDDRRTVTVRLSEGEHDLAVYYVAPSPTWRVSYRLVAESDDEEASTGKAILQGWGLFDNRLDEDLEDVRVTLVAGQPISFIYDLYASRIPQRPTVQDESRIAPGPIEYEAAKAGGAMGDFEEAAFTDELRTKTFMSALAPEAKRSRAAAPAEAAPRFFRAGAAQSTKVETETKDTGETFQYVVTAPVSVKRGESALVPIISNEIKYERELLYNRSKLPDHPVVALRFENTTGLTLERGPVTVVTDGDYKGEAVVPFTKDKNGVYLPFAVELGIKVAERYENEQVRSGMSIKDEYIHIQMYQNSITTYLVENTTSEQQTVTIETPIRDAWELYNMPSPDVETATERRWRVDSPAHSKTEFIHSERRLTSTHQQIRSLDYRNLDAFLDNQWLDQSTFDQLKEILDMLALEQKARQTISDLKNEREEIYKQQEQLRANMGALQPTGQEATLRNRLLRQLESTQDRLEEIDKLIAEAEETIATSEKKVQALIASLR